MYVRSLRLTDFRNFERLQTVLDEGVNIIYGDNAQGKTNFIEAIYFCATGRSIRSGNDRELIRFGAREAFLRVELDKKKALRAIDAQLCFDGRRACKKLAIDRVPLRKTNDLFGLLLVVLFSPEDLSLIKAGPAERRSFMDMELCQLSPVYCHDLRQYHHALKQRNALLKTLQKGGDADELSVWDTQLARYGKRVTAARAEFVMQAEERARQLHGYMTGGTEALSMAYRPNIGEQEDYLTVLTRGHGRDILMGSTVRGAHRDDVYFSINGADARAFGSQGQQRTAALSVKLAEIEIIRENAGTAPVLLLDDVLSELDERRQMFLLSRIGDLQTVLTCAGIETAVKKSGARVMRMENGILYG